MTEVPAGTRLEGEFEPRFNTLSETVSSAVLGTSCLAGDFLCLVMDLGSSTVLAFSTSVVDFLAFLGFGVSESSDFRFLDLVGWVESEVVFPLASGLDEDCCSLGVAPSDEVSVPASFSSPSLDFFLCLCFFFVSPSRSFFCFFSSFLRLRSSLRCFFSSLSIFLSSLVRFFSSLGSLVAIADVSVALCFFFETPEALPDDVRFSPFQFP